MNKLHIEDHIEDLARVDGDYAIAYAILVLTKATHALAEKVGAVADRTPGFPVERFADDGK